MVEMKNDTDLFGTYGRRTGFQERRAAHLEIETLFGCRFLENYDRNFNALLVKAEFARGELDGDDFTSVKLRLILGWHLLKFFVWLDWKDTQGSLFVKGPSFKTAAAAFNDMGSAEVRLWLKEEKLLMREEKHPMRNCSHSYHRQSPNHSDDAEDQLHVQTRLPKRRRSSMK